MESGSDLLSRAVSSQVPSALKGLTSVFGMGTGGTPSSSPPERVSEFFAAPGPADRLPLFGYRTIVLFFLRPAPARSPRLPASSPRLGRFRVPFQGYFRQPRRFTRSFRVTEGSA